MVQSLKMRKIYHESLNSFNSLSSLIRLFALESIIELGINFFTQRAQSSKRIITMQGFSLEIKLPPIRIILLQHLADNLMIR